MKIVSAAKENFKDKLKGVEIIDERYLNQRLVLRQKLTQEEIDKIVDLHNERARLFWEWERLNPENPIDRDTMRAAPAIVEAIEFALQRAWKFPADRRYHSWWYKIPHCACPKLDNQDAQGTDQRIYVKGCPVHG